MSNNWKIRYYQLGSTYYRLSEDELVTTLAVTNNISSTPAKHDIVLAVYRPSIDEVDNLKRALDKGIPRIITEETFEHMFTDAKKSL